MRRLTGVFLAVLICSGWQVEDCCKNCDSENFDKFNKNYLNRKLTELRKRTFFRIFQVNMDKKCTHLSEGTCASEKCQIEQCCDDDVPEPWRGSWKGQSDLERSAARVETDVEGVTFDNWDDQRTYQWLEPEIEEDSIYVDLSRNVDGWTGYSGKEAGMVWRKIYECNPFNEDEKKEKYEARVLFRIISGFHTMTTAKVFANMPLEGDVWGPNLELYEKYLHPHHDWINNLYFNFVLLLRAVNKARNELSSFWYHTGNPYDDNNAVYNIFDFLKQDFLDTACDAKASFDETKVFKGDNAKFMDDFRNAIREISTVLDCVGCEKCKLHAKLEFLGLGTALKILFTPPDAKIRLERNEIIALINTVAKFSDVLIFVGDMEAAIELKKKTSPQPDGNTAASTKTERSAFEKKQT